MIKILVSNSHFWLVAPSLLSLLLPILWQTCFDPLLPKTLLYLIHNKNVFQSTSSSIEIFVEFLLYSDMENVIFVVLNLYVLN